MRTYILGYFDVVDSMFQIVLARSSKWPIFLRLLAQHIRSFSRTNILKVGDIMSTSEHWNNTAQRAAAAANMRSTNRWDVERAQASSRWVVEMMRTRMVVREINAKFLVSVMSVVLTYIDEYPQRRIHLRHNTMTHLVQISADQDDATWEDRSVVFLRTCDSMLASIVETSSKRMLSI